MKSKKIVFLILGLFMGGVLSSCDPTYYDWRLNVKDGENINNDGGFGRFNERNSPPLRRLDAGFSSPYMNVRIFTPDVYGIYVGGYNPASYTAYGKQGHSEMRPKTWTINQMNAAVKGGSVSGVYANANRFYKVENGRAYRLQRSDDVRITGHTRKSGRGNGNVDVKLFPDRTQQGEHEFYLPTVILPNINN